MSSKRYKAEDWLSDAEIRHQVADSFVHWNKMRDLGVMTFGFSGLALVTGAFLYLIEPAGTAIAWVLWGTHLAWNFFIALVWKPSSEPKLAQLSRRESERQRRLETFWVKTWRCGLGVLGTIALLFFGFALLRPKIRLEWISFLTLVISMGGFAVAYVARWRILRAKLRLKRRLGAVGMLGILLVSILFFRILRVVVGFDPGNTGSMITGLVMIVCALLYLRAAVVYLTEAGVHLSELRRAEAREGENDGASGQA